MAVTRELKIVYGDLTINETNKRYIDGKIQINKTYTTTTVTFSFIIQQSTEALFATEISNVETAFRAPFRDLTISQGSKTLLSLSHNSNTGMNAKPTIIKTDHPADTGRSRKYTVSIVFEMPADNVSSILASGLRESTIDIRTSPSGRRIITISGIFTALSDKTARAQYEATINTYISSILTGIGGTYELLEKPRADADGTNKSLTFTHTYEELIYQQGSVSGKDDPKLIKQQFLMSLIKGYPGDELNQDIKRLVTVSINYDVWVDKSDQNLKQKWGNLKTWLVSTAKSVYSLSAATLIDENTTFNQDDNRITSNLTIKGSISGDNIIVEQQTVFSMEDIQGIVLVPIWAGDYLLKYPYQGPGSMRITITMNTKVLNSGKFSIKELLERAKKYITLGQGKTFLISSKQDIRPLVIGEPPNTHTITEYINTQIYEYINVATT